jgi:hypothetical protein
MMHIMLAVVALIAAIFVEPSPAEARVAPWCAVISMGPGSVYWDCRYSSIEECVPNVLSGNRGVCNHNPYYEGSSAPAKARKKRAAKQY